MQSRIAILYAPIIRFAVEIIHELQTVVQDTRDGPGLRILAKPFDVRESPTRTISPGLETPLVEKLDSVIKLTNVFHIFLGRSSQFSDSCSLCHPSFAISYFECHLVRIGWRASLAHFKFTRDCCYFI